MICCVEKNFLNLHGSDGRPRGKSTTDFVLPLPSNFPSKTIHGRIGKARVNMKGVVL